MAVHTSSVCVCVYGSNFSVAYTCFSEFELIENFRPLKPVLKNGCFYAEVSTTDFFIGGRSQFTHLKTYKIMAKIQTLEIAYFEELIKHHSIDDAIAIFCSDE